MTEESASEEEMIEVATKLVDSTPDLRQELIETLVSLYKLDSEQYSIDKIAVSMVKKI